MKSPLPVSLCRLVVLIAASSWAAGCGSDERGPAAGASITDSGPDTDDSGIDVDEDDKLDLGGGDTAGNGDDGGGLYGCTKVDLLFVIDNSGSMEDEQANLITSFPGFIDAMRAELADTRGYHVGITTSDLYASDLGNASCYREGALITRTLGDGASNRECGPYSSGKRFMTQTDDLAQTFACAGQVGVSGDGNERPMQTMLAALSSDMNGSGGCNEGFLRNDALLVVVLITDEEDDHETMGCTGMTNTQPQPGSGGEPQQWFDQLVDIKGGVEQNIVVLSLVGPHQGGTCAPLAKCDGGIEGAEVAQRVIDFTERFTYGFVGPVCEPYGPFFTEAIGQIKSACDGFDPVG